MFPSVLYAALRWVLQLTFLNCRSDGALERRRHAPLSQEHRPSAKSVCCCRIVHGEFLVS